jgi:pyruvate-ferredoxin/flavodoxin oxidoreductase
MGEVRYSSLQLAFPERAETLFAEAERNAKDRYELLLRQQKMYEPKAE